MKEVPGALVLNAILASVAFLIGVWFYFYIDRIPVARTVQEHLVVKPGSRVMIDGLTAGPWLSVNLRKGGRLRLSAESGGEIVTPSAQQLNAAPPANIQSNLQSLGQRIVLDMYKPSDGNAGVEFELKGEAPMSVEVTPDPPEEGRNGFHVTPRGGSMIAHLLMLPNKDGTTGQMTMMTATGATQWDEVTLRVSSGNSVGILVDEPANGAAPSTVVELRSYSRDYPVPAGNLPAGAVRQGNSSAQDFDTFLCGARRPGQKSFWPPIFPSVSLSKCAPGGLTISALDPFGQVSLDVAGSAFRASNGKPEYWPGLSALIANPMVSEAIKKSIMPALLAWVGLSLRALWKRRRRAEEASSPSLPN